MSLKLSRSILTCPKLGAVPPHEFTPSAFLTPTVTFWKTKFGHYANTRLDTVGYNFETEENELKKGTTVFEPNVSNTV